jgi:F420H(2)-dependent quinone reductase
VIDGSWRTTAAEYFFGGKCFTLSETRRPRISRIVGSRRKETIMSEKEEFEKLPEAMPMWIKDHVELYLSEPEKAHLWDSTIGGGPGPLPTLLLIARGAKSGKLRPLPLLYQEIDGKYVVIGSKGGAPAHPGWYVNLKANPECEIRVGAKRMRARARTASGEERTRGWSKMAAMYPPYDDYQKRAGSRQIPVVVLDPIGPA